MVTHHFTIPKIDPKNLGVEVYNHPPWAIYKRDEEWIYLGILPQSDETHLFQVGIFNQDHTIGDIYNPSDELFHQGGLHSLSFITTDQILIAQLLANREGALFHSAGFIIDSQGLLFVGHSGAGKSTIIEMLRQSGVILCDDRNIVRRLPDGWRIYGTWSHGLVPDVSPASAPLRAVFLLEQAAENRLIPVQDRREIIHQMPFFLIKPLVTTDWWEKTLDLIEALAREVPVYRLQFNRSGKVIDVIRELL